MKARKIVWKKARPCGGRRTARRQAKPCKGRQGLVEAGEIVRRHTIPCRGRRDFQVAEAGETVKRRARPCGFRRDRLRVASVPQHLWSSKLILYLIFVADEAFAAASPTETGVGPAAPAPGGSHVGRGGDGAAGGEPGAATAAAA